MSEAFSHLNPALGSRQVGVSAREYLETKFAFGLDTEAVFQAGFTSLSTKSGDLLIVKLKAMSSTMPTASMPTELTVYLLFCSGMTRRNASLAVSDESSIDPRSVNGLNSMHEPHRPAPACHRSGGGGGGGSPDPLGASGAASPRKPSVANT